LPKDHPEALDVLLSSEVGCEGLDFQFCDLLINYDLPWNPMRIEQRIGRIDRYGQKSQTVAITNFVTPGTVDGDIYERCLWRIGVFQHSIGGNEEILGKITKELHDLADSFNLTQQEREERLRQLADNSIRLLHEEQELESRQAELFGLSIPNQTWQKEIEAAESYWLSPLALQRCVHAYLGERLGFETAYLLGEKALKTLRLNQEARLAVLDDYRKLPRSLEPVAREWEKWLKGSQPTVAVTFDQATAVENPKAFYLFVLHPLVRQAARHLQFDEPMQASLAVQTADIAPGLYEFGLFRWKKQGVKQDEQLLAVSVLPSLENSILTLLQSAVDSEEICIPSVDSIKNLDAQHHAKWATAHATHVAENRRQVEHRIQSLKISHRARCNAIEGQIVRASNEKITLMKQSELARAEADFKEHMAELELAASSGDIHATPVLYGTIRVERSK
jgi:hypothetical protein